jgi:hypothetical protein
VIISRPDPLVGLLLPLLFLPLALGCSKLETRTSSFADMKELRSSGYLDKGWIPSCLPETSRDIMEQHDLDTNRTWISIQLSAEDLGNFKKRLMGPLEPERYVASRPGAPDWWPPDLLGGVWLFRCLTRGDPKNDMSALVDEANGRVFLWKNGY